MATLDTLAAALADQYDTDPTATRRRVEEVADRLPADQYDPATATVTDDGEAAIRDQYAYDYHGMTPTAQRHDSLTDLIRRAGEAAADHQCRADEWTDRRDSLIREAIAAGVRVADIVEASGLSRARVYQIRDERR